MPCLSYEDDSRTGSPTQSWQYKELKANNDKLARIACKALFELERVCGSHDLKLVEDDQEVAEWWTAHKEADRKAMEARLRKAHEAVVRKQALDKLSDEEKKILGITK